MTNIVNEKAIKLLKDSAGELKKFSEIGDLQLEATETLIDLYFLERFDIANAVETLAALGIGDQEIVLPADLDTIQFVEPVILDTQSVFTSFVVSGDGSVTIPSNLEVTII